MNRFIKINVDNIIKVFTQPSGLTTKQDIDSAYNKAINWLNL